MLVFLVDEDLPRSLAPALVAAGFQATDVRDEGLRGRPDDEVFDFAIKNDRTLISADMGFANIFRYALGSHSGIVVSRFPNEVSTATLNAAIVAAMKDLDESDIRGSLVIVEPDRIRLRRAP